MSEVDSSQLWQDFPKTLPEFLRRFPDERSCRDYLVQARWGGKPWCPRCQSERVSSISRHRFHCLACHHQTTVTAGTLMQGTHKPLQVWFYAIWLVCVHRTGISAKGLQRVLGFGCYETAWSWLHRIRRAMVDPQRSALSGEVEVDEGFIKGASNGTQGPRQGKAVVLIAAERGGRLRLAHAPNNDEASLKRFVDEAIDPAAKLTTDGLASYNPRSLGERAHDVAVQSPEERADDDALQHCHWGLLHLKRWWYGTHHGAISAKYLQAYLDEFVFRYNRRKTNGVGRLVARVLQNIVRQGPLTLKNLVRDAQAFPLFREPAVEGTR